MSASISENFLLPDYFYDLPFCMFLSPSLLLIYDRVYSVAVLFSAFLPTGLGLFPPWHG